MNAGTLNVGDLCVTINSKYPLLNEGSLIVVVAIDFSMKSYQGELAPYRIRRVDGQIFIATSCLITGKTRWGKYTEIWAARHHLRRVDDAPAALKTEHETKRGQPCIALIDP